MFMIRRRSGTPAVSIVKDMRKSSCCYESSASVQINRRPLFGSEIVSQTAEAGRLRLFALAATRGGYTNSNDPLSRRSVMKKFALLAVIAVAPVVGAVLAQSPESPKNQDSNNNSRKEKTLKVHYLEIVTPEVNETCEALEKAHGVKFGEPIAELGNARTAKLKDGGRVGVRAPMRKTEAPVVRPYVLVDDIDAALKAAEAAGAKAAMRRTKIPGHGDFAIYVLGGIDHGLWQL